MCLISEMRPVIGGGLARPYEHFPSYFKHDFWREYPYFLSCLGPAIIVFTSFLVTLFFFQEVIRFPLALLVRYSYLKVQTLPKRRISAPSSSICPYEERSEPLPLKELLTYPVVLSVFNYASVAFMDVMFISLLPLFMAMPIELGGLGFTPMAIGYVLGTLGVWSGLFSMLFSGRLLRRFGERKMFIMGMLGFTVNFTMFPLINIVAHRTGVTWVVWCLLTFSLSLVPVMDTCFSKSESKGGELYSPKDRLYIHFHYGIIPKQKLTRCYEWHLADDSIDCAGHWSCACNITLLVLCG